MAFDYSKLAGKIREKFGTQMNFAAAMEISERTLSLKMNNRIAWTQTEIIKACNLLGVKAKEVHLYFFAQ